MYAFYTHGRVKYIFYQRAFQESTFRQPLRFAANIGWMVDDHTLLSGWLTLRVVPFYIPKLHETKRVEYESQFYIRRNDCLDDLWDKATTESYLKDGFQPWLKRCR